MLAGIVYRVGGPELIVFIEWVDLNCVCGDCVYRVGGPELCVQGLCL